MKDGMAAGGKQLKNIAVQAVARNTHSGFSVFFMKRLKLGDGLHILGRPAARFTSMRRRKPRQRQCSPNILEGKYSGERSRH